MHPRLTLNQLCSWELPLTSAPPESTVHVLDDRFIPPCVVCVDWGLMYAKQACCRVNHIFSPSIYSFTRSLTHLIYLLIYLLWAGSC